MHGWDFVWFCALILGFFFLFARDNAAGRLLQKRRREGEGEEEEGGVFKGEMLIKVQWCLDLRVSFVP